MARNKYPEETVNLILDVSAKLFVEKGYDETSIQDIIDHLGGLSKGAIYHHFKSKESILVAIFDRMGEMTEHQMSVIRDDKNLTGLEKLKKMFASSLMDSDSLEMFAAAPNLIENPRLLAMQMVSMMEEVVPKYIEPVIRQGVEDGSIKTDYPKELGEMVILMSNIWMNPLVYSMTKKEIMSKIAFFKQLTEALGIPVMDKGMEQRLEKFCKLVKSPSEGNREPEGK